MANKILPTATKSNRDCLNSVREALAKSNNFGKISILASLGIIAEGDSPDCDADDLIELTERLYYGEISRSEYLKNLAGMWAKAHGLRSRPNWQNFAEIRAQMH